VQAKVLVTTTHRWYPTARLAMALANAGCHVEAVCPPNHPLLKTSALHRIHRYYGLAPLTSFERAIVQAKPDFIVSSDDLATQHLHRLHDRERHSDTGEPICSLIERSLGAPESFPIAFARAAFMDVARQEAVRVPTTEVIRDGNDLRQWVSKIGFPFVLKANGTSGGDGVRVVYKLEDAERAFRKLEAPPVWARAAKRALVDRDKTLIRPCLLRRRPVVNAQTFVAGREATSTVFCWQGAVLASLHFEVLNKMHALGHATTVRLIEHPEMSAAAEKMVRRLGLSGLYGFDFMLEAHTGNAYLIEMNPRATQVGHLALGPGKDLPAALYAALSGNMVRPALKVTETDTIVLFPQEWVRDPASKFLRLGYHDVPWEEPELVDDCIRKSRIQRAWYAKRKLSASRPSSLPLTGRSEDRLDCQTE